MPELESLLRRLVDAEVDFVVVGGYAAVAHGVTLVTQDMDVCCRMSCDNLMRLQNALADLHPQHRMTSSKLPLEITSENAEGFKNLYLTTDLGQLDCLGEVLGLGGYEMVESQSQLIDLGFGSCRLLTISGLIKAKAAMNRPRDKETIVQLRAIQSGRGSPSE